jgi:hypothetical protein
MSGKASAFPHQSSLLGEQPWHLSTHQLVAHWLFAVGVELVGVGNLPRAAGISVVVGHGLYRGRVLCLLRVERVAVPVLGTPDLACTLGSVHLEDGVGLSIDLRIHAQTEQMLMVVGVDTWVHLGTPAVRVLARVHRVCVQDTGQLDIQLNGAILVEDPVHAVLVVGRGEDVRDDQLPSTCDDDRVVPEVSMLEQDARILLVDADGVLDDGACTRLVDERGVHVVNGSLAVTAQRQAVGHVSTTVFTQIEGVLALMRVLRVAVRHDHLGQRQAVHDGPDGAFVVEGNVVQHDALPVVESDVDVPLLPVDHPSIHFERDALGLGDVDGLDIRSISAHLLDRVGMVAVRLGLVEWSPHRGDVNVHDRLGLGVVDGAEVERVAILRVVDVRTVVHQRLLQTDIASEALVVSDRPR